MVVMQANFSFEASHTAVNQQLGAYFDDRSGMEIAAEPAVARHWQALRDVSLAGGKRLRPFLFLWAYQAYGEQPWADAVPLAAGIELLHIALLAHDDVIDRDYTRHGQPNVSGYYDAHYASLNDAAERHHYADAAAILAGNLALSGCYDLVFSSRLQPAAKELAAKAFSQTIYDVVGGELLDVESSFLPGAEPLKIALHKTAGYTFVAPLTLGARLAGASEQEAAKLKRAGTSLGIAYQLADDVADITTGRYSDIYEGKQTYLNQQVTASEKPRHQALYGKADMTKAEATEVAQIIADSGAIEAVNVEIERYRADAYAQLSRLAVLAADERQLAGVLRHFDN